MEDIEKRRSDRWNFLFIAGMWFQDLFNYDFRRTEQCIIPYATQEGEISFCAYNTGVGWRNIIEKMHMTATLTKWYAEKGRHEIFAGGKKVSLDDPNHKLILNKEDVERGRQKDLDDVGIAKNAREEKVRARDEKQKVQQEAKDREMERLYRKVVLKEEAPEGGFVPLSAIAPAKKDSDKVSPGRSRQLRRLTSTIHHQRERPRSTSAAFLFWHKLGQQKRPAGEGGPKSVTINRVVRSSTEVPS